jgi:hypothetical protein
LASLPPGWLLVGWIWMIDRSGLSVDAALSFSSLCTHTPQQQQRMRILNSFSELSKRKIVSLFFISISDWKILRIIKRF